MKRKARVENAEQKRCCGASKRALVILHEEADLAAGGLPERVRDLAARGAARERQCKAQRAAAAREGNACVRRKERHQNRINQAPAKRPCEGESI
jgi:hypothetical protein